MTPGDFDTTGTTTEILVGNLYGAMNTGSFLQLGLRWQGGGGEGGRRERVRRGEGRKGERRVMGRGGRITLLSVPLTRDVILIPKTSPWLQGWLS